MILFSKQDCPLCSVAKIKLNNADIQYNVCEDENKMKELGITMLPVLQLDSGQKLSFQEIIEYLQKGVLKQ